MSSAYQIKFNGGNLLGDERKLLQRRSRNQTMQPDSEGLSNALSLDSVPVVYHEPRQERVDLLLDLNDVPCFTMHQPPQGYFAPGADATRLAGAVLELVGAVGEFEKPRFFAYKEKLCAHSRSKIGGRTACIDGCSTNAIASDCDHVKIEPLCMGCGASATVCPSGALSYTYPDVTTQGTRLKTLLTTYREADGRNACVLFHNRTGGHKLIAGLARHGKDLPARVIPLDVHHVASTPIVALLT